MLSFLRRFARRECPTCHKLFDRDRLARHEKRHEAGFGQYKRFQFSYPDPSGGPFSASTAVTYRKINGAWSVVDTTKLRAAIASVPNLKDRILNRLEMLNLPVPNPGSDEAVEQGCSCPVLDNEYGYGAWGTDKKPQAEKLFWRSGNCSLHRNTDAPTFTRRPIGNAPLAPLTEAPIAQHHEAHG